MVLAHVIARNFNIYPGPYVFAGLIGYSLVIVQLVNI